MTAPRVDLPSALQRLETPFGTVEVDPAEFLEFPGGILGLASYKKWVLLGSERADRFWLQSVEEPGLTLPLIDPFAAFPGYALDVPPQAIETLGAPQADDVLALAPVTLGRGDEAPTANLRGPILINWQARRGLQLVVDAGPWTVREPLPAAELVG